jgi:mannosyltransferase
MKARLNSDRSQLESPWIKPSGIPPHSSAPFKSGDILQTATAESQKSTSRIDLARLSLSLHHKVLIGLVAAGAFLRFYLIASKSIWLDEAFSIVISQRSLFDVLNMTVRTDTHPPLYYLLLKIWLLFGNSEAQARSLSAVFSIAAIPLMYKVSSSLFEDKRAGLLGAAILTFSPFQIWYAQEVRMYAMLTFFVLASAYFFIQALKLGAPIYWAGYVVTTSLALYTDNGAIWYVASISIFFLLFFRRFSHRLVGWVASNIAVGLIYLPWLPFFIHQTQQVTESFWLPPPSFKIVLSAFLDFQSYNFPLIEISLLYLTTIFVWAFIVPRKSWQQRLASLWLFLPLLISLLLSLRQPIFLSRNLIAASLGYYLLVVATILKFKSRRAALALLLPLLAMNLVSIGRNAWVIQKEDWRDAARYVANAASGKEGGLVVFLPGYAELPFQYYFKQYHQYVNTQGYPGDELLLHPDPKEVQDLGQLFAGHPYVWLVMRDAASVDPDSKVKGWLDTHGYTRSPDYLSPDISVLTYVRWDKVPASRLSGGPGKVEVFLPNIYRIPGMLVHEVKKGETLLEIAVRYNVTVADLVEANTIQNPTSLHAGQILYIPIK